MRIPALLAAALLLSAPAYSDLIDPLTSAPVILIPVAGDAAGVNGTHFRSDISITNFRDVEQTVQVRWLPQGRSSDATSVRTITIGARSGFSSEDFVRNILQQTGIGAIQISGLNDTVADPAARLHVTARIWTPQPDGGAGTFSQTFPATVFSSASSAPVKWIFGVRRDARYRLNVGIANPSSTTMRFRVIVTTPAGNETQERTLPPLSVDQTNFAGTATVAQVIVQNVTGGPDAAWQAWASSIDNATGDAWSEMAFPAAP